MAIAFSKVINKIRELAQQNPERVAACTYFNDEGEPICIVGKALSDLIDIRMGSSEGEFNDQVEVLVTPDGEVLCGAGDCATILPWKEMGFRTPTEKQLYWVGEVQANQDAESPWAVAVADADEAAA